MSGEASRMSSGAPVDLRQEQMPIVVADASKLGEVEVAKVCDLADVSVVVTDRSADPAVVADITAAGCEVRIAD
jgi:DeoR family transcriptional regulator of aga operon